MQHLPHGICVVINNKKFPAHPVREGTEIDEKNLSKTFRYLGYNVEVYRDCKARGIKTIFRGLQARNFDRHDSFVCCILSHGDDGKIIGSDSLPVELDYIRSLFTATDKCPTLKGKPKMFFIQACRLKPATEVVKKCDRGFKTGNTHDGRELVDTGTRPAEADFFFGYAAPRGNLALRNEAEGSWYVSELCRVFCTFATFTKLQDMITKVKENVGTGYDDDAYGKQAPTNEDGLGKEVYFF